MKPISIIVVDDVESIQNLLRLWLEERGHVVACASSGRAASKRLRAEHFDLVVADVLMPDGDGIELINELKAKQPDARILAISGGGTHLRATDCLMLAKGLGAHAVLQKPFNRQQLLHAIDMACPPEPAPAA
ncbi:MAG TPA: response regulator [Opitutaceae bacterium]|nr:response regulator [Opitutaceae bacterium]